MENTHPQYGPIIEVTYENPQAVFAAAIKSGFLNTDRNSDRYAGAWMYMHTDSVKGHAFKNINRRNYIYFK